MFSKNKPHERNDSENREQYEYARRRLNQKKGLMRHFVIFLAGSIFFIILNLVLGFGAEIRFQGWDWYIWAILLWGFILLVHLFNVLVMNKFMDKEWENIQLERLKAKQADRIAEIQKKVDTEIQLPGGYSEREELKKKTINNPYTPDIE